MRQEPNKYLRKAVKLAEEMKALADNGEIQAPDESCAVLFGVIRDCAYSIQNRAELEERLHMAMQEWNENGEARAIDEPDSPKEGGVIV